MQRIIIECIIVVLLVLIGISIFMPNENNLNETINSFEESVEASKEIEDGVIAEVEVEYEDPSNLFSRINAKIANILVKGLNGLFEGGLKILRKVID